ncbi:MAG TPA: phytanoyl-CoA dioxygenase family protein [Sphingomonas sp.]|jgi:ectoine hydroxylase-related dioxygenase (phytanoyl-CoA dioxygenase family)|uniref:phytanoyl-CoA dioxygenase family protein n=1 Tax=Sphingomonas sp. TaxID=28214 RepID=UPI002ED974E3
MTDLAVDVPGVRIGAAPALRSILAPGGTVGRIAAAVLGPDARAVRAVLFDKTPAANWSLGWHQDRTIVVAERVTVAGFGPWTIKSGLVQVEPPFVILERMVTLRIHLDAVDATNAPLRIVPGSHRLGRIAETRIASIVAAHGERTCLADRGDIWCYATSILHASRAADPPRRRRVLQVDYSTDALPDPLCWRGV